MPSAEAQRNQLVRCPAEEIGLSAVGELSRSVEEKITGIYPLNEENFQQHAIRRIKLCSVPRWSRTTI